MWENWQLHAIRASFIPIRSCRTSYAYANVALVLIGKRNLSFQMCVLKLHMLIITPDVSILRGRSLNGVDNEASRHDFYTIYRYALIIKLNVQPQTAVHSEL